MIKVAQSKNFFLTLAQIDPNHYPEHILAKYSFGDLSQSENLYEIKSPLMNFTLD